MILMDAASNAINQWNARVRERSNDSVWHNFCSTATYTFTMKAFNKYI